MIKKLISIFAISALSLACAIALEPYHGKQIIPHEALSSIASAFKDPLEAATSTARTTASASGNNKKPIVVTETDIPDTSVASTAQAKHYSLKSHWLDTFSVNNKIEAIVYFRHTVGEYEEEDEHGAINLFLKEGKYNNKDLVRNFNYKTMSEFHSIKKSGFTITDGPYCPATLKVNISNGKATFQMFDKNQAEENQDHYVYDNVVNCAFLAFNKIMLTVGAINQYEIARNANKGTWPIE